VDYTIEFLRQNPGFRPTLVRAPLAPVVVAPTALVKASAPGAELEPAAEEYHYNRAADLARSSGLNRWTVPDLARAESLLIGAGQTAQSNLTLAAVQYALSVSPATQVASARAAAGAPTSALVVPQIVPTPGGVSVARGIAPGGALASALSVVGGASAPGRAGGAAGIVAPPVPSAPNATVAALATLEQFFAANPPDP